MNNIDYKKIKAWPFQEAIKLKNKVSKIPNKKVVTLETGQGPSGDPHIGTFAEVLRTNMVLNCLKEISDFSTNLIGQTNFAFMNILIPIGKSHFGYGLEVNQNSILNSLFIQKTFN